MEMQGSLYTTVAEAVSPVLVSWQVLCCLCFCGVSKGEGSPAVASSSGLSLRGLLSVCRLCCLAPVHGPWPPLPFLSTRWKMHYNTVNSPSWKKKRVWRGGRRSCFVTQENKMSVVWFQQTCGEVNEGWICDWCEPESVNSHCIDCLVFVHAQKGGAPCVYICLLFSKAFQQQMTSFLKSFSGFLGKEEITQPKTGGMHCTRSY